MASEPIRIPSLVRLGEDFEFDFSTYVLRRGGRVLKLERIPAEVLAILVEHRGQIVSREHIVERIWGKGTFLDTDNSINGAIRKIRQVLKDDSEQPRFIQTVTGKGYRFIAPVGDTDVPKPVAVPSSQTLITDSPTDTPARWRWPILLGISVVVIAALGIYLQSRFRVRHAPPSGRLMLAVLPFENLTGDASQDYFSDGLTEEMISQLGDLDPDHVGVIARTSVMHYKHSQEPLDQIGRALGVQYVLEGSVRRDSDRVRIAAQLIQTRDQTHLWTREYDRELTNVFALQGEIAREIADQIQLTLGHMHETAGLVSQSATSAKAFEAYDLYLKGRYWWNKRTREGLQQAVEYFQQAINKDPAYARAYAGLAESYALMGGYTGLPPKEFMAKARAAARRALELDEQLPEAHTALAVIAQNYDWDWQTAEKEYRRAIQLDPNYATGHHWYAECLALQGRFDEAFSEIGIARKLEIAIRLMRFNTVGHRNIELALGTFHQQLFAHRDLHALGQRNYFFTNSRHKLPRYHNWQSTSPPTRSLRAELPVMTPRAVVKILMPRPPSTLGTSWLPTYTRHPGRETRSILEITGRLPGVYFR